MGWFKSKKGVFSHSGPHYLTNINWNDLQHKRTIMASLVRGVYILEQDRQKYRHGTKDALAPPWWESFNFKLDDDGILKNGSSIFGAIFQFKHPASPCKSSSSFSSSLLASSASFSGLENAPQYVVAFRGTMLKGTSILKDLSLDAKVLIHCLDQTSCFQIALDAVINLIKPHDLSKVWIAGHSLGSAIAMLVVKKMVCGGYAPLKTYLFNPPFPSAPIDSIKIGKILRDLLHVGDGMLRVATATAAEVLSSEKLHQKTTNNDLGVFDKLSRSGWIPYLFVNKEDTICKGFIGYFERRQTMKRIGMGNVEILNMRISRVSLFMNKIFGTTTTPLHVLPSAVVVTSSFTKVHSLDQWYHPDVECHPPRTYAVNEMLEITGSSVNGPPQIRSTD